MKEALFSIIALFCFTFFCYAQEDFSASYSESAAFDSLIEATYADADASAEAQYANESTYPYAWAIEESSGRDSVSDDGEVSDSQVVSSEATIDAEYSENLARSEAQNARESTPPVYWGAVADDPTDQEHYIDLNPRSDVDLSDVATPPALKESRSPGESEKPFIEEAQGVKENPGIR